MKLVYLYSTIKMMQGPINIRLSTVSANTGLSYKPAISGVLSSLPLRHRNVILLKSESGTFLFIDDVFA